MTQSTPSAAAETLLPTSYEAAVQELENLVAKLDAGQLPLDDVLAHYRRAEALLDYCRGRLSAIEQQIQVLDQGEARPWQEGA
jgi:exodeoxyribonuclease VII small subunit